MTTDSGTEPPIRYQVAFFDAGGESWRFYREDYDIVAFDALELAEAKATELSQSHPEAIVLTLHACFATERAYTRVEIAPQTRRVDLRFTTPKLSPSRSR